MLKVKVNQDVTLSKTITNIVSISSDKTPPEMASVDIITDQGGWMIEGMEIIPDVIRRNDAITDITAVLIFPEGIRMGDIGEDPLVLFPGDIEAREQIIEETDGKVKITAVFDKNSLLDIVPDYYFGPFDVEVVGVLKSGRFFYGTAIFFLIGDGDISDYISRIYIEQCLDYGDPTDSNDLMYEFNLRIYAYDNKAINMDADVNNIEILTPTGNTFRIPKQAGQWSNGIWTSYEYSIDDWGITARWEYRARFSDIADLQAYGDGEYTIALRYDDIMLHYANGAWSQTTAWFGIPDTNEPIPQPTQEPVLISPLHHQTLQSPIIFSWEPCTDPNAADVFIDLYELGTTGIKWGDFDVSETSWGPVYLPDGIWEAMVVFEQWIHNKNNDGITINLCKYSTSKYKLKLQGCPWNKYEVWGGDIWIDWRDGSYGNITDLVSNGYVKLGESDGQTATFSGQYQYYLIATVGEFLLDSIQGSDGSYYSSFEPNMEWMNITEPNNLLGPQDGKCAIVGVSNPWNDYSGFVAFTNPDNWMGLTVITSDLNLNISKDIENSADELASLDTNDTITYIINVDSNDFTNEVTDVTIVDILPDEVDFVSVDSNGISGEYDPETHTYKWLYPFFAPESAIELRLIARMNPDIVPGTNITNFVTINSNEIPPTTASAIITTANLLEVNDVQVSTGTISTGDTLTNITFIIELPEGVGIDDIANEPLILYPGNINSSEHFIEEIDGKMKITAVFDKDALLDAVPDYYGPLDLTVKGTLTSGQSFYGEATITIIKAEDISDHIFLIYFEQIWDYGNPTDNNDLMYEFFLEIGAGGKQGLNMDANVASIEFRTPAGNTFQIPKQPGQWSDDKWTSYEYTPYEWGGDATWEYRTRVADIADLQAYGDGEYIITVHYKSGNQSQTTAWLGISDTNKPIGQPTQEPVLTFPEHNQTVESPVTFTWQPCTNADVADIWIEIIDQENNIFHEQYFDVNETSWGPISLTEGIWKIVINFEQYVGSYSSDGILISTAKHSKSKYELTILDYPYNKYEVWGGDIFLSGDSFFSSYWFAYELEANGYIKLGESDGQSVTFQGEYQYYIIPTWWQFRIDSIQGLDGSYLSLENITHRHTANITDPNNIFGPPDGLCATIGKEPWYGDAFSGFFVFNNPGNWTGLTVITRNLNIGKSIMNPIEDIENIGPNDTITYNICFDSNDLVDSVTDVTVVDFLPDEVSFVSADSNEVSGEYNPETHTYTWLYPSLAPESAIEMQLIVQVNPDVAPGTTITNFVTINSNETLPTTASANIVYNRVVGDLQIVPDTIRRNGTITGIMAVLKLPEGIYENIDTNEPLVLSPVDQDEIKIRANDNPIVTETDGRTTVIAVFDKTEVMNAIPDYGEVGVEVVGKFTSGHTFYGKTTITITRFAGN